MTPEQLKARYQKAANFSAMSMAIFDDLATPPSAESDKNEPSDQRSKPGPESSTEAQPVKSG